MATIEDIIKDVQVPGVDRTEDGVKGADIEEFRICIDLDHPSLYRGQVTPSFDHQGLYKSPAASSLASLYITSCTFRDYPKIPKKRQS